MKIKLFINKLSVATMLGLLLTQSCKAEPASEYKLKAAFIYNFIQLTEWPKTVDDSLRLCIGGLDPIADAINNINGAVANSKHIKIIRLLNNASASIEGCEVLYLSEAAQFDIKRTLNKLGESPILTISDNMNLAKSGVMINMFPEGQRLVFSLNIEATKQAHLILSSRLIQLAKYID
jgi:hypothetical protein